MKNILQITIMVLFMIVGAFSIELSSSEADSSESRVNDKNLNEDMTSSEVVEIKVRDAGVERSMIVPLPNPNLGATLSNSDENPLILKKGIIINFNDENLNIEEFESLFNLKLEERLVIGYYIFENTSSLSDVKLIEAILNSESSNNIKTIRPNWKMRNKAF